MGAKCVYCVSIVYYFYAGCTRVAPDIKKERRLVDLEVLRHPTFHYGVEQLVRCTQYFSYPLRRLSPNLWFDHHTYLAARERS